MVKPTKREPMKWPDDVAFLAHVHDDWTLLELPSGDVYAFEVATGMVRKLPDKRCPFIVFRPDKLFGG